MQHSVETGRQFGAQLSEATVERRFAVPEKALHWRGFSVARQAGFEPTTRGLEGRCSILLSYWRESGRADLNGRPPAPKAGALPGCATPRPARRPSLTRPRAARNVPGSQARAERPHGARPVAHPLLCLGARLGERAAELVGDEHGIVAKARAPRRAERDVPGARSLGRLA